MTSIAVEELFGRNLETSRAPNPWPAPSTQETEPFEMFGKGAGSFFDDKPSSDSEDQKDVKKANQAARDSYYGAYSYATQDFSSSRGLSRDMEQLKSPAKSESNGTLRSEHQWRDKRRENHRRPLKEHHRRNETRRDYRSVETVHETIKIESRRTVACEGNVYFEETNVIQFPKNLPPNVHVITAAQYGSN
ncbi:DUF1604 domain-containing protein [Caenorhabditis elegans]|uniref:DUF1604 domain-containing protein n=2 Tax=Caenorhabditis elegans TaxID=6239 RepID=A0A0K3AXA5_CAEEL|nr:DUF1604 domain-containing protein [Caenorhabditis elegans]CTQ86622.1 DUF1604 domain-containing protein [Caenorhabditis elegans]|eukprot:NP_001299922.1 Uncharacterized protein CELE_Y66D12A.16 [Caenorhabditis elegans]